jgi:tetratricopeptide (TPR) repeat protein
VLGRAYAAQADLTQAFRAFGQALAIFRTIGDRFGGAQCSWHFGLALARQGDREGALPLLRACLAYEQEVGHAKAAEHAALLERIEAGEAIPQKASRRDADQAAIALACEVNA